MARVKETYLGRKLNTLAHVYQFVEGDQYIDCGMQSDGKYDHQPPVYVLHRFADGGLVTLRSIREHPAAGGA